MWWKNLKRKKEYWDRKIPFHIYFFAFWWNFAPQKNHCLKLVWHLMPINFTYVKASQSPFTSSLHKWRPILFKHLNNHLTISSD
jgi:hypothetical protein